MSATTTFLTAPLLYLLTLAPPNLRAPVLNTLSQHLSNPNIHRLVTTLKFLLGASLVRIASRALSSLAQNNFRLRSSEAANYDWPNEIAVVTGAASGFGRLICEGLAARGLRVVAVDLGEALPEDMVKGPHADRISYYRCDVTDRQAVIDVAERIKHEHGFVSVLVNNAGVLNSGPVLDLSEADVRKVFDVNVVAHFWTLQAFLPAMVSRKKGHVVTLASLASFVSTAGLVPYSCSKSAVLSLHEGMQQETRVAYDAPEIKWTSIHPTFAATAMAKPWENELKASGAMVLKPETVADAVVKQVISGRSAQIVLANGGEWLSSMRAWPHWFAQAFMRLGGNPAMSGKTLREARNKRK